MIRRIKVNRKWQGERPIPSIILQGKYLKKFNFNIDDKVRIELYNNEIRIKKYSPDEILKEMEKENANLRKLIENLDLSTIP